MEEYEATFEIETKSEAYAVERLMERLYNAVREESRTIREESGDSTAMLSEFETLRDASERRAPGSLTVRYVQRDESFDD